MSRFQLVEDHQDTYEVKRLRPGRGGTLVAHTPGEPASRPVSGARPRVSDHTPHTNNLTPSRGRRAAADAALTERIHLPHRADPTMGAPRTDRRAQRHCPRHARASEP